MTPIPYVAPWYTTDLTLGLVHKLTSKEDGSVRYVVLFPKTWEPVGPKQVQPKLYSNETVMIQTYRVLTWEERDLVLAAIT